MDRETPSLTALLSEKLLTSAQLQKRMGVSQSTVSRLISALGGRVVRLGHGRSTRYALARAIPGIGDRVPVYEVNERGIPAEKGVLRPLASGAYTVQIPVVAPARPWLLGHSAEGLYDSLPYFVDDLRPQGFLGRQLARRLAQIGGYPADPREWSDVQVLTWLVQDGDDLPGNLLFGDRALDRFLAREPKAITDRARDYPALAESVLLGEPVGSSAGGEQPKFTAFTADRGHVLVKFSPKRGTPEGDRWAELLVAEQRAAQALTRAGLSAVDCMLFEWDGRVFLEVRRFDRVERRGRCPLISLAALDAEFVGLGTDWVRVAERLHATGLIDADARRTIAWCHAFGQWIGNADMHLGNLSFAPVESGFALLPVYDMTPMQFAPVRGELLERPLVPPPRYAATAAVWEAARAAAVGYWRGLASDRQVSDPFRVLADRCANIVASSRE